MTPAPRRPCSPIGDASLSGVAVNGVPSMLRLAPGVASPGGGVATAASSAADDVMGLLAPEELEPACCINAFKGSVSPTGKLDLFTGAAIITTRAHTRVCLCVYVIGWADHKRNAAIMITIDRNCTNRVLVGFICHFHVSNMSNYGATSLVSLLCWLQVHQLTPPVAVLE